MASLRTASPSLRNYFKEKYIPQVCEVLLCGLLVICPQDPLTYLEEMIITIMKNGLKSLKWDMCIDATMKPKIRRLSETYLEQLFGLDDQLHAVNLMVSHYSLAQQGLPAVSVYKYIFASIYANREDLLQETMTPELMTKACTFYTGHLVKTHFCVWKDIAIHSVNENDILAEKMEKAMKHYNFSLQKYVFCHWHAYVKDQKEQLREKLLRIQQIFTYKKIIISLAKWREKAKEKYQKRQDELMLKHENQLKKWKTKVQYKRAAEELLSSPEQCQSEDSFVGEISECDISLLPEKAILQIDFSTVKNVVTDNCTVSTLRKWRLNVLRLNFHGCLFRSKTLRSVSLCKNLQELNVSDCPTLTDESMRYISEGCPGVLCLNLSNTAITNRTMRLLPRHFHNLQNLSLAYCKKFTDRGLRYLNLGHGCHKLIYLDLSGCTQISVQGFKNIANSCTGIMHLTINDMPTLTDNCVKALVERCPLITSIIFIGAPHISDSTFKALSTCNLRKIRFEGNKRITDACFKFIDKHYPNISHIYMVDCKGITDGGLKSLSPLKQLRVLNLANCVRIGDTGLKQFLDGPSSVRIRELNLSNCINLSDASFVKLSESCPNLNYLNLRNCEHLTDLGIAYIVNIFSLISIDLSGTDVSNEGLIILSKHRKLKELSVSECCKITDDGIQAFCRGSLILEHLDVSYCPQLSNEIITALAIYCLHLTSLSIAGCPKITDSAMEMLSAKCHYLHILNISGCVLLTDRILEDLQLGCRQLRILKMQYCRLISQEAAKKMSSVVQQQQYSPNDPPLWFGYDCKGNPLQEQQDTRSPKNTESIVEESTYGSEEEVA